MLVIHHYSSSLACWSRVITDLYVILFLKACICICCRKRIWGVAWKIAWIVEVNFLSNFVKSLKFKLPSIALWDIWTIFTTFYWRTNSFISTESPSLEILFGRLALGWTFSNWLQILIESEEKLLYLCSLIAFLVSVTQVTCHPDILSHESEALSRGKFVHLKCW